MDGLYIAFAVIMIIGLAIDYAAQFQAPNHKSPSDVVENRAEGDDAA